METQNATIHLSPPMLTTRPFALRHRAEPVKKKNRESDLPHSQPTSQTQKSTSKMDEDAGDIHDPKKKKKWELQVPTKLCSPLYAVLSPDT
jgi:hypothetical protein